jgi:hypothetical protein
MIAVTVITVVPVGAKTITDAMIDVTTIVATVVAMTDARRKRQLHF